MLIDSFGLNSYIVFVLNVCPYEQEERNGKNNYTDKLRGGKNSYKTSVFVPSKKFQNKSSY